MSFKLRYLLLSFALISLQQVRADTITVSNLNTDDIVIPVFDQTLGNLQSVSLEIEMLAGSTNTVSSSHNHAPRTITSSTVIGTSQVGNFTSGATLQTSNSGAHSHGLTTPNYVGGGLDIGAFSTAASSSGNHSHVVTVAFSGLQQVSSSSWRVRATLAPQTSGVTHSHNYAQSSKTLNYSGNQILPFLAGSDITIPAGTISTNSGGGHIHSIGSFSRFLTSSSGNLSIQFPTSTTNGNTNGLHSHTIDPRFNVTATFDYAAVPEPSLAAISPLLLTTLLRRRR